jgi:signal peptidase
MSLNSTGSPFHNRGDLLLLTNYHAEPIRASDVVVFEIRGYDIPIIHRVIRVHER